MQVSGAGILETYTLVMIDQSTNHSYNKRRLATIKDKLNKETTHHTTVENDSSAPTHPKKNPYADS